LTLLDQDGTVTRKYPSAGGTRAYLTRIRIEIAALILQKKTLSILNGLGNDADGFSALVSEEFSVGIVGFLGNIFFGKAGIERYT